MSTNTFYSKSKLEKTGDYFADELLIDDQFFEENKNKSVEEIAKLGYVSCELIKLKYELNYIN